MTNAKKDLIGSTVVGFEQLPIEDQSFVLGAMLGIIIARTKDKEGQTAAEKVS